MKLIESSPLNIQKERKLKVLTKWNHKHGGHCKDYVRPGVETVVVKCDGTSVFKSFVPSPAKDRRYLEENTN